MGSAGGASALHEGSTGVMHYGSVESAEMSDFATIQKERRWLRNDHCSAGERGKEMIVAEAVVSDRSPLRPMVLRCCR